MFTFLYWHYFNVADTVHRLPQCLEGGGGDMDVQQFMIRFLTLKSEKGAIFSLPSVSNFHKNMTFFSQLTEQFYKFFQQWKDMQLKIHFPTFWGKYFGKFSATFLQRVQNFAKILGCKG